MAAVLVEPLRGSTARLPRSQSCPSRLARVARCNSRSRVEGFDGKQADEAVRRQADKLGSIAGLLVLIVPKLALADGNCSGCTASFACLWVCAVVLGVFAVPLWRVVRPHLLSLPLSFLGCALAGQLAPTNATSLAWLMSGASAGG